MEHRSSRSSRKRRHSSNSEDNSNATGVIVADMQNYNLHKDKLPYWPYNDLIILADKVEENVPENDTLAYNTRIERLNWEKICFKNYTPDECKNTWTALQKHVRKYRILKEIVCDVKQWIGSSNRHVLKHPDMPKQPYNAYLIFALEKRQSVAAENPKMNGNDIMRVIGKMYKNLTPKEKEKYDRLASQAREVYTEKLKEFYKNHPEYVPKKKKNANELDEIKGVLKKPKTPFQIYTDFEYEREGNDHNRDVFNEECQEKWDNMKDEDKLFWINWAEEEFNNYSEEVKKMVKEHPQYTPEPVKCVLTKQEKSLKERLSGKPPKPPMSAYHLFTKMMSQNQDLKHLDGKLLLNYISNMWANCSEDEKNEYKTRVEQMWEKYYSDLQSYLETIPAMQRDEIQNSRMKKRPKNDVALKPNKKAKSVKLKEPELPPLTEYEYFKSVSDSTNPAKAWKKLSPAEKQTYKEKLVTEKRNYIMLYEQFLRSLTKEELEELARSNKNVKESETDLSDADD